MRRCFQYPVRSVTSLNFLKKFYLFFILDKSMSPVYFSRLISFMTWEVSPVSTDTNLAVRTFEIRLEVLLLEFQLM